MSWLPSAKSLHKCNWINRGSATKATLVSSLTLMVFFSPSSFKYFLKLLALYLAHSSSVIVCLNYLNISNHELFTCCLTDCFLTATWQGFHISMDGLGCLYSNRIHSYCSKLSDPFSGVFQVQPKSCNLQKKLLQWILDNWYCAESLIAQNRPASHLSQTNPFYVL